MGCSLDPILCIVFICTDAKMLGAPQSENTNNTVPKTRQIKPWWAKDVITAFLHCGHSQISSTSLFPMKCYPGQTQLFIRRSGWLRVRTWGDHSLVELYYWGTTFNPAVTANRQLCSAVACGTAIDDWITGSKALFITKGCLNGLTGNPASAKSQSFLPLWRQVIFAMKYCTSIHSIQPLTLTFGRKVAYS